MEVPDLGDSKALRGIVMVRPPLKNSGGPA